VYCGKETERSGRNREHFIPRGLWDGPRPNRTLTVPAHKTCNGDFAVDDEFFRDVVVAMQGADKHPVARKLIDGKVTRSYERRPHLLAAHLRNFGMRETMTSSGMYLGAKPVFEVEMDRLQRVLNKICRGLFYAHTDRPLAETHVVQSFTVNDEKLDDNLWFIISNLPPAVDFGDTVFRYRYYLGTQDANNSYWLLMFYEAVLFVGRTVPKEIAEAC
jgi:hypothetical protein